MHNRVFTDLSDNVIQQNSADIFKIVQLIYTLIKDYEKEEADKQKLILEQSEASFIDDFV